MTTMTAEMITQMMITTCMTIQERGSSLTVLRMARPRGLAVDGSRLAGAHGSRKLTVHG
jgi:hypothetical protein